MAPHLAFQPDCSLDERISDQRSNNSHAQEFVPQCRPSFPANSRADAAAGPRPARHGHPDHRPSRAGVRQARASASSTASRPSSRPPTRSSSTPRPAPARGKRRSSTRSRPGDTRADGRDRPVRHLVEEHGDQARPRAGVHRDRLAHRRRPRGDRGAAARGQGPRDQGGLRGAQRDLDRLPVARSPRSARRSMRPAIRRCSWSTPSRRSPRPTTATTSGASTSPSAARRRA